MVWPLMLTLLSALNEPLTVNVWPLETEVADMPENEMDAVSGKLPVSAPYALDPWLLLLTPCPAVYKKVSDDGLFLLLRSQTRQGPAGGGGGDGGGQVGHAASFG